MPVSDVVLWIFWVGGALYAVAVLAARIGSARIGQSTSARSPRSLAGIILQSLAIALAGIGRVEHSLPVADPRSIMESVFVALLLLTAAALFRWSSRTMGKNWSLVARTRADHELVTSGPFALVRHPIYVSMLFFLLALSVATGHYLQLPWALPVFALGTWIRIVEEEKLLRAAFGPSFDAYARRTRAFIPGLGNGGRGKD